MPPTGTSDRSPCSPVKARTASAGTPRPTASPPTNLETAQAPLLLWCDDHPANAGGDLLTQVLCATRFARGHRDTVHRSQLSGPFDTPDHDDGAQQSPVDAQPVPGSAGQFVVCRAGRSDREQRGPTLRDSYVALIQTLGGRGQIESEVHPRGATVLLATTEPEADRHERELAHFKQPGGSRGRGICGRRRRPGSPRNTASPANSNLGAHYPEPSPPNKPPPTGPQPTVGRPTPPTGVRVPPSSVAAWIPTHAGKRSFRSRVGRLERLRCRNPAAVCRAGRIRAPIAAPQPTPSNKRSGLVSTWPPPGRGDGGAGRCRVSAGWCGRRRTHRPCVRLDRGRRPRRVGASGGETSPFGGGSSGGGSGSSGGQYSPFGGGSSGGQFLAVRRWVEREWKLLYGCRRPI